MNEFVGKFMFHPVGHGLFYSGTIKNCNDNNHFSFVYDCGGCNPNIINSAIENADLPSTINLLIISHFHEDHINGVLKLKNKHKIETVILPYLDPTSKNIYMTYLASKNNDLSGSKLKDLENFICDPVNFFSKDTKVFFISNDVKSEESKPPKGELDFDWLNCIPDNENKVPGNASYGSKEWSFHFFMPKTTTNDKFIELQEFFENNHIEPNNVMKTEERWEIIKNKVKKFNLNNNISNLVCAHGPTENVSIQTICNNKFIPSELFDHCWEYDCWCYSHYRYWHDGNIGFQFLTGDAEIDKQDDFIKNYQSDLRKSILFQVPHHGSKANWKDWFSEYQPFCNLWPVTHNANHEYRKGIFPSATFSYIAPYSVTEVKSTGLGIQIHFTDKI